MIALQGFKPVQDKRCTMKKLTILLYWGLLSHAWALKAGEQNFTALLEEINRHGTEEIAQEVLEEHLWERYHAPLDLNQATPKELQQLGILTASQREEFFKHLAQHGSLSAVYDLQKIPSFDVPTIRRLVPFVRVVPEKDTHKAFWPARLGIRDSYALMRYERVLETRQGYLPDPETGLAPYLGSPDGVLMRLHIRRPSGWGLGLSTLTKAGEAWAWDPATHYYGGARQRFYGLLKHRGSLETLVVGDYAVGYGEGLVLNAGFSMNKTSETVRIIRTNNLGIRPHTALTQAAWRGGAATWKWQPVKLTIYGSMIALDGKVRQDAAGYSYVETIYRGGDYRAAHELAKKAKIQEQVVGSTLVYQSTPAGITCGFNALYTGYSLPIFPSLQRHQNPMRFRGQEHANASLFYRYLWQNCHLFGEGAWSTNHGGSPAVAAGVVMSLSRYADATVMGRYYSQAFHAPYGHAFRENASGNSNERGLYLGVRLQPDQPFYLDGYYDYFYFPWFYGLSRAGQGWLAKVTYQPQRSTLLYFQYKGKHKPRKVPKRPEVADGLRHQYKVRYQHAWSRALRFKTEVQWSSYQQLRTVTRGYAAVQDVAYKVRQLQLQGRVAWFRTDDHLNKLAFYEPNVLYSGFNFPAYQGRGIRYGLLVCYKPGPAFRIEMKYALTHYHDRNKIGKQREAIAGNVKNEVKLQAILKF